MGGGVYERRYYEKIRMWRRRGDACSRITPVKARKIFDVIGEGFFFKRDLGGDG
jgi:hypothetical protein